MIGDALFTEYSILFIIMGILLLLAMIAAIILSLEKQLQIKTISKRC
jgi:NADH:ubiquinone oxidoreductase subunit 6 (subunit J)